MQFQVQFSLQDGNVRIGGGAGLDAISHGGQRLHNLRKSNAILRFVNLCLYNLFISVIKLMKKPLV